MQEKLFLKSVINNRNSNVYIWYIVVSWVNPNTKEASSVLLCVRISVTSQAQLATITSNFYRQTDRQTEMFI